MPMNPHRSYRHSGVHGFTLVEILIVVLILGILAAIVIPQFADASDEARRTAFVESLLRFGRAAEMYQLETGQILPDPASGVLPAGFDAFVDEGKWTLPTPIGGAWDSVDDDFPGMSSGVGVHFSANQPTDAYMAALDTIFDDGDLNTGAFRKFAADRFYYIIIP